MYRGVWMWSSTCNHELVSTIMTSIAGQIGALFLTGSLYAKIRSRTHQHKIHYYCPMREGRAGCMRDAYLKRLDSGPKWKELDQNDVWNIGSLDVHI